jgi:major membrane immunogen (membrane-anchored lipoprotein)
LRAGKAGSKRGSGFFPKSEAHGQKEHRRGYHTKATETISNGKWQRANGKWQKAKGKSKSKKAKAWSKNRERSASTP